MINRFANQANFDFPDVRCLRAGTTLNNLKIKFQRPSYSLLPDYVQFAAVYACTFRFHPGVRQISSSNERHVQRHGGGQPISEYARRRRVHPCRKVRVSTWPASRTAVGSAGRTRGVISSSGRRKSHRPICRLSLTCGWLSRRGIEPDVCPLSSLLYPHR